MDKNVECGAGWLWLLGAGLGNGNGVLKCEIMESQDVQES